MNSFKTSTTSNSVIVGVIIVIIILAFLIPRFSNKDTPSSETEVVAQTTPIVEPVPIDPAVLEADKKQLALIKTKFNYKYDEFEKKGWYEAKTQIVENTFDSQMIKAYVNNVGYAYILDQYYGDDWIFHTRLQVKIGDAVYASEDVPTYDPDYSTENSGGSVWESISYTAGKDNGIFKAIAESGEAVVKVRFAGDRGVKDFTLSKRDQQAIKDAYQLSDLIKKVGDTGVPQS